MAEPRYNGIINVYKERGWTSMDVCAKLRSVLHEKKIGHAGTLDPMAEGVLPVALGRATKSLDTIGDCEKEYRAGMLLGTVTETDDITGEVMSVYEGAWPDEAAVRAAVMSFVGSYDQLTPRYSARKVGGKKLYEYARAGIEVERKSRNIRIFEIEIEEIRMPHVRFRVRCSKGTYIRALCRDIGEALGCGACMESLTRTQVGAFRIEDAVKIPAIRDAEQTGRVDALLQVAAPTAISIGKFDGTHIGHQVLLKELRRCAADNHLKSLVLILKFGKSGVLSDAERKAKLYGLGIDYCIEMEFTDELKAMSAEEFLEKVLVGRFQMKAIVAGKDVSFGRGKAGNADFLYAHADQYGYQVHLIDKVRLETGGTATAGLGGHADGRSSYLVQSGDGMSAANAVERHPETGIEHGDGYKQGRSNEIGLTVSSTLLRECIRSGDMARAAVLLGSPYAISGTVVHGKGIAADKMSYPTMNIEVPDERTLPPFGVYAVRAVIDGTERAERGRKGADKADRAGRTAVAESAGKTVSDGQITVSGIANLGERPTVHGSIEGGTRLRLEVHAFEEIGDCYGKTVRVELLKFIRPEQRFEDLEELTAQIREHDIPAAMEFLKVIYY